MHQSSPSDSKGFTLIELMVVISIVVLLSSVVIASLNIAHAKARDGVRVASVAEVNKAISLFRIATNTFPKNYIDVNGTYYPGGVPDGVPPGIAIDDPDPTSANAKAYAASMQELVDAKTMPIIIHNATTPYYYFNDTVGNTGVIFGVNLELSHSPQTLSNDSQPFPTRTATNYPNDCYYATVDQCAMNSDIGGPFCATYGLPQVAGCPAFMMGNNKFNNFCSQDIDGNAVSYCTYIQ